MAKQKHNGQWVKSIGVTAAVIICLALLSQFLLNQGILVPYEKNGIDKVQVSCEGEENYISTQRYIGFKDYTITKFHSFVDLPITSYLSCSRAHVDFVRKASLLDRVESAVFCDDSLVHLSSLGEGGDLSCQGTIRIEVYRR